MSLRDLVGFSAAALRGHRLRSGLSLLGVAIGVASVILLTGLGHGARLYVGGQFATMGTNLLLVLPGKTETTGMAPIFGGVPNDVTVEDAEAIARQVRQVRQVAPMSLGEAQARHGQTSRRITVAGTTAEFRDLRKIDMLVGRFLPAGAARQARQVCAIGSTVRRELFGDSNPLGEILHVGNERFRVVGVVAPRGTSIGIDFDDIVYVPVRAGMRMFNRSTLFRIFIEVRTHEQMDAAKQAVIELIRERHHGMEDITILTQDALLSTFGRIMLALTAALAGIAAISLTVAGLGIMNVMLVSVSERTAEIGLLKALGASRGQIQLAFIVESAILSSIGGALGLTIGFGVNQLLMAYYPNFPVRPPEWAVVGAVVMSVLVGIVFGVLPARRASRLDPVASLAGR